MRASAFVLGEGVLLQRRRGFSGSTPSNCGSHYMLRRITLTTITFTFLPVTAGTWPGVDDDKAYGEDKSVSDMFAVDWQFAWRERLVLQSLARINQDCM